MKNRGLYIVIEGHDGTGKSTQVKLLRERLQRELHMESIEFHEPAGTPMADAIRTIIKDGSLKRNPKTNVLLFNAARSEIWQELAMPALEAGKIVVASRNWWSTLVYQGCGEGIDPQLIENSVIAATNTTYIHPDIGVILSMKNEIERERRINSRGELEHPDTFESKNTDFQSRVGNGYQLIAKKYNLPIIDASQSIEMVADNIWKYVQDKINIEVGDR